jgi:hypothetical protein
MSCRLLAAAVCGALAALPAAARAQSAAATPTPATAAEHHAAGSGWAELDAYHQVMAAAWHPAAQKNDLAPARARMAELARKAAAWSRTAPPAGATAACQTAATPKALAGYAGVVRGVSLRAEQQDMSDATLKEALKDVHDRFHAFEAACGGGAVGGEHRH